MSSRPDVLKRWLKRFLIALVILAVGSAVGVLSLTPRTTDTESSAVVVADADAARRGMDAYAARYSGLAQHYASRSDAARRATDAYAARYAGLA
ncbi:MAG: hypothetical protein KGY78_06460, partial [Anaerolineae bacterium]|nr:hypothetical protein [Anaerolineae bacterium]